jgi:hypothetical protein
MYGHKHCSAQDKPVPKFPRCQAWSSWRVVEPWGERKTEKENGVPGERNKEIDNKSERKGQVTSRDRWGRKKEGKSGGGYNTSGIHMFPTSRCLFRSLSVPYRVSAAARVEFVRHATGCQHREAKLPFRRAEKLGSGRQNIWSDSSLLFLKSLFTSYCVTLPSFWGGFEPSPLLLRPLFDLLYQPRMMSVEQ